jgi:hypothetical protein
VKEALAIAAVAAVVILAAATARPTTPPVVDVRKPLLLRLEGVVSPTREAAAESGFTAIALGFLGSTAVRWLGVTDARTVGADQFASGKDVLAAVAPFTPNLLVAGPSDPVGRLRAAPPGTRVVIEGLVARASRIYYLRRVEGAPAG